MPAGQIEMALDRYPVEVLQTVLRILKARPRP
jgi:hypothetical protein